MVFSSTFFLFAYLPIVIGLYYVLSDKFKNVYLLLVSLVFYGWGEPKYIVVLIVSMIANYIFAILIGNAKCSKKVCLILSVIFNIGVLFVFSYLNFTVNNIERILGIDITIRHLVQPIGISFFTFQAMSYVIDIYKEKVKALKNPIDFGLYISFFPQLVAGPIIRFGSIEHELKYRKESWPLFREGVVRFIIGLSKKVILSNSLAIIADYYFGMINYGELTVLGSWVGSICYTLQIYFDFSGYSDMAIGLGKMFGFNFPENFNYPYISKTITEFWRRWHITLSSWFRDYVYIPLGGNRVKKIRLLLNLFIVWLLTGVWHGASWNFVLWGMMYYVLLVFEKCLNVPNKTNNKIFSVIYRIFTLICVNFGWVLFRAENLMHALNYIKSMLGLQNNNLYDLQSLFILYDIRILLLVAIFCSVPWLSWVDKMKKNKYLENVYEILRVAVVIILFIIACSYCINGTYNPFIYFNF